MPFPLFRCIKITALFLVINLSLFGKGNTAIIIAQDSIVKMSGYVYDTIRDNPDTIRVAARAGTLNLCALSHVFIGLSMLEPGGGGGHP